MDSVTQSFSDHFSAPLETETGCNSKSLFVGLNVCMCVCVCPCLVSDSWVSSSPQDLTSGPAASPSLLPCAHPWLETFVSWRKSKTNLMLHDVPTGQMGINDSNEQISKLYFLENTGKNNLQQAIVQKTIRITRNLSILYRWWKLWLQAELVCSDFSINFNVFVLNFILWPKKSIY